MFNYSVKYKMPKKRDAPRFPFWNKPQFQNGSLMTPKSAQSTLGPRPLSARSVSFREISPLFSIT